MDSVLTLSLVILFLPLLAFVILMVLGKAKTPTDYVIDPNEHAAHEPHAHGSPADEHTADHVQHAVDTPHDAVGHAGHHYEFNVTKPRGPWTEADQKRAYRLSWIGTGIMGLCLALSI